MDVCFQTEGVGLSQSEQQQGHEGKETTAVAKGGSSQDQPQTRRKPGQADTNRSLGSVDEKVKKNLKSIDSTKQDGKTDKEQRETESDLYEHIKDATSQYDAQTLDVATAEQQQEQSVPNLQEEEGEEPGQEDVDMKPDDSTQPLVSIYLNSVTCKSLDKTLTQQDRLSSLHYLLSILFHLLPALYFILKLTLTLQEEVDIDKLSAAKLKESKDKTGDAQGEEDEEMRDHTKTVVEGEKVTK